ncbi:hypothetical protein A3A79_01255 [Candidatus Gottesmanbacteria bacterium RIFCSPLOWO2_01_FULL_43_11b]|uniref:O-antigen ligase-related domain-containing protein n=1 Tax=Candidatus Gottesmanbacteria bacterium RIFCSPLOWO2_01_FULL_43_11b TaxID=1798392 RepID=A0A1F6AHS4_9BACT|nr:MAG: hypothetical protein A3A79_01255 [Candidatus Gottesmanbacteria bacterium RIFCSPLOWO2_01_FULL_43_11b]
MSTELIIRMCNRVIHVGFFLLFALVPLLLTPWNYELFEYNKMMAVYFVTAFVVTSWIIKSLAQKEFRITRTPLDIPIVLFVISQLISSIFSMDPHVSWFGYYSRFNGGMWSIVSYALLYYAFVSNIENITLFIKASLSTAIVISLYGVAERLGIDKHLWVQDVQNRVFSTLGQPNWLAAYLVALSPIALTLRSPFSYILSFLLFAVLLFTRSRSGLLGFAVADGIYWVILYLKTKKKLSLRLPFIIYHLSFIILFALFSPNFILKQVAPTTPSPTYTAPLLESGGTESGTIRKYVWEGAVNVWKSSTKTMLIGTGTETFAFAFYQFRPAGHNMTSEWDFLYNKAHNEYLNSLATTGLLGLGSYVFFLGLFIWWFIHQKKQSTLDYALFTGWLSILVTNFFGFSVVVTQLFLFLFPAMIFVQQLNNATIKQLRLPSWTIWILIIGGAYVLIKIGSFWYADTLFAAGYRFNRAGSYEKSRIYLTQATKVNPNEPFYHDELGSALSGLAVLAIESQDATGASKLAQESIKENDRALTISPNNVNFWKSRTKIFYSFATFDPQFNRAAIGALEKALSLSPNDPKIMYNLAILFGREGNNEKAIELLQQSVELKRNYRDAYYALFIFYNETKQPDAARAILQSYLDNVDPSDSDFQERIKQ